MPSLQRHRLRADAHSAPLTSPKTSRATMSLGRKRLSWCPGLQPVEEGHAAAWRTVHTREVAGSKTSRAHGRNGPCLRPCHEQRVSRPPWGYPRGRVASVNASLIVRCRSAAACSLQASSQRAAFTSFVAAIRSMRSSITPNEHCSEIIHSTSRFGVLGIVPTLRALGFTNEATASRRMRLATNPQIGAATRTSPGFVLA